MTDITPSLTPATIAGAAQEGDVLSVTGGLPNDGDATVSYQWQSSSDNGQTWSNISGNLPDALILLQATRPKLVIVASALRATRDTHTAEKFNRLVDATNVVELPSTFSTYDAGEAGERLLHQVRAAMRPM